MIVTRRFDERVAVEIEELEDMVRRGDAHHRAVTTYLAALLICEADGSFKSDEAVTVEHWMVNLGGLAWARKNGQTVVQWKECLN